LPEAFARHYQEYLPKLYAYVGYRVNAPQPIIEDLTAEIFEKAFRHLVRHPEQTIEFKAWIFRIAHNHIVDYFRSARPSIPLEVIEDVIDSGENINESLIKAEESDFIRNLLEQLPEREQEIIALKFSTGYNNREIASMTGLSESNVGTILHRTLRGLQQQLVRHSDQGEPR